MSKLTEKVRILIHENPLQKNVRSQLRALEKEMTELDKFEMLYYWEVLMQTEAEQALAPDESD